MKYQLITYGWPYRLDCVSRKRGELLCSKDNASLSNFGDGDGKYHGPKSIGVLGLIFLSSLAVSSWASTPSESHSFRVHGLATYRCYGGYGAQKDVDSRSKATCDNQTYKKALIDDVVEIQIKNDPTPDNSKDLAGDWEKDVMYQGRKFTVALTLFKHLDEPSKTPYTLRAVVEDDQPQTRHTATFSEASHIASMNPLTINYVSAGQPEEISYDVTVEPLK